MLRVCYLYLASFLCITIALASSPAVLLQQQLLAVGTMQAHFEQQIKVKQRIIARSSGIMLLKRPGMFRWDTQAPMQQQIVADGKKIWIYDIELEQVTMKQQSIELSGTPALFLSSATQTLEKDFTIQAKSSPNGIWYHLSARSAQENFQAIDMYYNKRKQLTQLSLYDALGQTTLVQFTHIKTNMLLNNSKFKFIMPFGVDLIQ